jgi:prepilin-type N-terminal cleavage/methylation domain-containing protein/prepilin-type processing-associated H-X9-DG protein
MRKKIKYAFTLLELLIVIAIITILVSMLLPALTNAKERTKQITCMSNLKQLHLGIGLYTNDYDYYMPQHKNSPTVWGHILYTNSYIRNLNIFYCAKTTEFAGKISTGLNAPYAKAFFISQNDVWFRFTSYGYNVAGIGDDYNNNWAKTAPASPAKPGIIKNPSSKILAADTVYSWDNFPRYIIEAQTGTDDGTIQKRHLKNTNILWVDGHTTSDTIGAFYQLESTLKAKHMYR